MSIMDPDEDEEELASELWEDLNERLDETRWGGFDIETLPLTDTIDCDMKVLELVCRWVNDSLHKMREWKAKQ